MGRKGEERCRQEKGNFLKSPLRPLLALSDANKHLYFEK